MARINKFAAQNLNDIYGKKEPKPAPPDNGNSAGIRARTSSSSSHGGMLVLRPPVKQPPSFHFKTSTTALKNEAAPPVVAPSAPPTVSAINTPVSSPNPCNLNETENSANNKQEILPGAGSNPGSTVSPEAISETLTSPENSKAECSDSISLRPNRRPEIYNPPSARTLTTAVPAENAAPEKINACSDCTVETVTLVANPFPSEPAQPVLERETVEAKEGAAPEVVKVVRPEPFRPPHLRGDVTRRFELATAGSSSLNPPPAPPPPREDSNPGHGWFNRGGGFHQRNRREETEGRYARDAPPPPQQQQRYDRDERGGGGYFNRQTNSFSPAYSRPGTEPRNYDIEIIRPGSGGSDIYDINNNAINNSREFGYRGREGFERQRMSPPTNPYWGEGQPNYDAYNHRQDFDRQEGLYRRNYNNNNSNNNNCFKPGGMNRDFQSRDGYGYGGPRREPYGRNNPSINPFMGAGGQFAQAPANNNGRFSGQPREQYSRMHRDGAHRYGGGYQRPRSGGYDGAPSRPRSSGYGARSMGSSDSMVSRPNFYNGLRSPISQERAGHQEFGPQGRYHYDGPNDMQNVDVGYYRPTSGGYGGHAAGRSMASSDMASRPHKYNGSMSPVSCNKMDSENFSNRALEPYHLEGSFSSYEEVDAYRTRGEVNNGESNMEGEHQNVAWDSSTEYNLLNLESSKVLVKSDPRLNVDQRFYVDGRGQYYTEEEKRGEDAREEIMEKGHLAQGISVPKRQDEGVVQEMREEVADDVINREGHFECFDPHIAFQETSGQFNEEHNLPNVDSDLKEQEKLADRFASCKITANRTRRPFQNDSASSMRPSNYHAGRDAQLNSYASRSSAMSWRREPNEMRNGSFQRFSSQYGDNNYRPGSRDSTRSDRYQF